VLDGAVLAATTVDAHTIVVAVDRASSGTRHALAHALDERARTRVDDMAIRIVDVPSRYVAGEEKALINLINGGDAKPTFDLRPYEQGVRGRATLVQNVETLAHIALIARFGHQWFRQLGSDSAPGTALVTIGGAVQCPGVYEIELGTRLSAIVTAAGGMSEEISAFLTGGYYGTWIAAAEAWDLELGPDELGRAGAAFGCGILYALPTRVCGLSETAHVARYLAGETAGQCGPCVVGLAAIADALDAITFGDHVEHHAELVRRWCTQVDGRGACRMPDGASRFVRTALDVFAGELDRHAKQGRCQAARGQRALPVPSLEERARGWR
jgi:NADH:ubiquinone oxidoreductase subunit F (NADH-binding)